MAIVKGTGGNDTRTGTSLADQIYGYDGNDKLSGLAGNDSIYGGNGNDTVYGGIGDDSLFGDAGTDTIYGDAGNDILKGGSGISHLYGGAGTDTAYYDPSGSDIDAIGNYLSGSYIEAETVYIYNKTTDNGVPTKTLIYNPDVNVESHDQHVAFGTWDKKIEAAYTEGNPELVIVGDGGLDYHGPDYGGTSRVTGTAVRDEFHGGWGKDILKGGGGNDDFYITGGYDVIISETNDADQFFCQFSPADFGTSTTITGFNGAGAAGGDVLRISNADSGWDHLTITESGGKTTFVTSAEDLFLSQVTIDAVGLKPDLDYFLA